MPASEQLKALVDQMPDPDPRGMYCENIDKDKIDKAVAEICKGGRESIVGLIDMLVPPGDGADVKPHYALHCVALHVCKQPDRAARQLFTETLASQLGGSRPKPVQAYLCQELQAAGDKEAVAALGKLLIDEELCEPAAMALTAIDQGAAEQFRAALPNAKGKCRLTVLQNLGVLRDKAAAPAMLSALSDSDVEIRLAAGYGLARLADAGAVDRLLKAADSEGWERIQQTKHCLVLAENLKAAGKKDLAVTIYRRLRETRTDPKDAYIRQAAEKGLAGLEA